jgi:membrane-bound serine protease (ClpP class)
MLPLLTALSPNAAVLILTAGLALIALELNRPGSVLPGALGLVLSLLAAASLAQHHPRPDRVLQFLASMALLLLQARRPLLWIIPTSATILLILAVGTLLPSTVEPGVSAWTALLCGLILGTGTTILTRIARRARQNKGLD